MEGGDGRDRDGGGSGACERLRCGGSWGRTFVHDPCEMGAAWGGDDDGVSLCFLSSCSVSGFFVGWEGGSGAEFFFPSESVAAWLGLFILDLLLLLSLFLFFSLSDWSAAGVEADMEVPKPVRRIF